MIAEQSRELMLRGSEDEIADHLDEAQDRSFHLSHSLWNSKFQMNWRSGQNRITLTFFFCFAAPHACRNVVLACPIWAGTGTPWRRLCPTVTLPAGASASLPGNSNSTGHKSLQQTVPFQLPRTPRLVLEAGLSHATTNAASSPGCDSIRIRVS